MIRVLLADDQVMVRSGLAMILGSYPDITVTAEVDDGASAVEMASSATCDVVLMDIRMPVLDGIAATAQIKQKHPDLHVLVLTTFDRTDYLYEALHAGAEGFLLKSAPSASLVEAVRTVAAGDALVDPAFTKTLIATFLRRRPADAPSTDPRLERLTPREQDVLVLVAKGMNNAEIAEAMHLSTATVKSHMLALFRKLGVRDRVGAVVLAYEAGLVDPHTAKDNEE